VSIEMGMDCECKTGMSYLLGILIVKKGVYTHVALQTAVPSFGLFPDVQVVPEYQ